MKRMTLSDVEALTRATNAFGLLQENARLRKALKIAKYCIDDEHDIEPVTPRKNEQPINHCLYLGPDLGMGRPRPIFFVAS